MYVVDNVLNRSLKMNRVQVEICFRLSALECLVQTVLEKAKKINQMFDRQVTEELRTILRSIVKTREQICKHFKDQRDTLKLKANLESRIRFEGELHEDIVDTHHLPDALGREETCDVDGDLVEDGDRVVCLESSKFEATDTKEDVKLCMSTDKHDDYEDTKEEIENEIKVECNIDVDDSGDDVIDDSEGAIDESKEFEDWQSDHDIKQESEELRRTPKKEKECKQECEICGKMISRSNIHKHRQIHSGEKPHPCSVCGKRFPRKFNLKSHMRIHGPRERILCQTCGQSFLNACNLKEHLQKGGCEKYNVELSCKICGKIVKHERYLRSHMMVHSEEKPFSCEVCGETFRRPFEMNRHKIQRHDQPRCEVCARSFSCMSALNKHHKRVHSDERPFSCDVCGKAYKDKHTLDKHKQIHSKEELVKCDVCNKTFLSLVDLKTHCQRAHSQKVEKSGV